MVLLLALMQACTPQPRALPVDRPPSLLPPTPCAPLPRAKGVIDVTLLHGAGVDDRTTVRTLGRLRGILQAQGLDLGTVHRLALRDRYAIGRAPNEGSRHPFQGWPTVPETLHLAVVQAVVDPRSTLARSLRMDGIGLSEHPGHATLYSPVPLVIVAEPAILDPSAAALLAHEMGHTADLSHTDGQDSMADTRGLACYPGWSSSQLKTIVRELPFRTTPPFP